MITEVTGTVSLEAAARQGKLAGLTGAVDFSSLNLAGRPVTNFKCELLKPEAGDALRIGKISGDIAGGALAGQVDLVFPDKGPSRFGLGLVLRNAEVSQLAGASANPTRSTSRGTGTASRTSQCTARSGV